MISLLYFKFYPAIVAPEVPNVKVRAQPAKKGIYKYLQ